MLAAAQATSVGMPMGVSYLTSEDPADTVALEVIAEKAAEFIEVRMHNATLTGTRGQR